MNFKISSSVKKALIFGLPVLALLFNDHFLKTYSPNFITGKLSDLVGLIVWFVFFLCIFPKKGRDILIWTVILFTFWKSPYSQFLIDLIFDILGIKLQRIVDFTDLWALFVLLPVYYFRIEIKELFLGLQTKLKYAYYFTAFIAICATSAPDYSIFPNFEFQDAKWILPVSKIMVFQKTQAPRNNNIDTLMNSTIFKVRIEGFQNSTNFTTYNIQISLDSIDKSHSRLTLNKLYSYNNNTKLKKFTKDKFLAIFQNGFVNPVSTLDSVKFYAWYSK
jgi:hypothetical protein